MTGKPIMVPLSCTCLCHREGSDGRCGWMQCCDYADKPLGTLVPRYDALGLPSQVAQHKTIGGRGAVGRIKR